MAKVTIPDLTIRTTSDQAGCAQGLAIGAGATLDSAVEELKAGARRRAEELACKHQGSDRDDVEWSFEVVGVRLVPGPSGATTEAWVCYGTLASDGRTPWAGGNYWDRAAR